MVFVAEVSDFRYWNYYAIAGNSAMVAKYDWEARRMLYKWLDRRSQRRSMSWPVAMLPSITVEAGGTNR